MFKDETFGPIVLTESVHKQKNKKSTHLIKTNRFRLRSES